MITEDELDRDPWPTYPVNKDDLRELLACWDRMNTWYNENPDAILIEYLNANPDGSANCAFTVGSRAVQKLLKEGLIAVLEKAAHEYEVQDD